MPRATCQRPGASLIVPHPVGRSPKPVSPQRSGGCEADAEETRRSGSSLHPGGSSRVRTRRATRWPPASVSPRSTRAAASCEHIVGVGSRSGRSRPTTRSGQHVSSAVPAPRSWGCPGAREVHQALHRARSSRVQRELVALVPRPLAVIQPGCSIAGRQIRSRHPIGDAHHDLAPGIGHQGHHPAGALRSAPVIGGGLPEPADPATRSGAAAPRLERKARGGTPAIRSRRSTGAGWSGTIIDWGIAVAPGGGSMRIVVEAGDHHPGQTWTRS